jgi:hypothetical protein
MIGLETVTLAVPAGRARPIAGKGPGHEPKFGVFGRVMRWDA